MATHLPYYQIYGSVGMKRKAAIDYFRFMWLSIYKLGEFSHEDSTSNASRCLCHGPSDG